MPATAWLRVSARRADDASQPLPVACACYDSGLLAKTLCAVQAEAEAEGVRAGEMLFRTTQPASLFIEAKVSGEASEEFFAAGQPLHGGSDHVGGAGAWELTIASILGEGSNSVSCTPAALLERAVRTSVEAWVANDPLWEPRMVAAAKALTSAVALQEGGCLATAVARFTGELHTLVQSSPSLSPTRPPSAPSTAPAKSKAGAKAAAAAAAAVPPGQVAVDALRSALADNAAETEEQRTRLLAALAVATSQATDPAVVATALESALDLERKRSARRQARLASQHAIAAPLATVSPPTAAADVAVGMTVSDLADSIARLARL